MTEEIGMNGIEQLISALKKTRQLNDIKVKIEPFVMPYIKKKYMDKQMQESKKRKKLKKYFSYSLLRKQCDRSIYYSFIIPPDIKLIKPDQQINMDSGTWLHKMYEEYLFPMAGLVSENYKEKFIRKSIKDDDGNEIILLIKPDFIIEYKGDKRVIDVKTLLERYFNQFKTNPEKFLKTNISGIGMYMQAQFYMYVTELDKATILAHNRNNSRQFEVTIYKNEAYIKNLIDRCKNIMGKIKKRKIPNRHYFDKKQCKKEYCAYINECWRNNEKD